MSASRPIRLLGNDFAASPLPTVSLPTRHFLRLHGMQYDAACFRLDPDHRFSHPDAPGGLLYLAEDFDTCVWECFGDEILTTKFSIDHSSWISRRLSNVLVRFPLKICDLTALSTRRTLGVDLGALCHTNLDVPHAWGLAVQTHPSQPDGLCYLSRFTDRPCLALFERPGIFLKLAGAPLDLLADLDEADAFLDTHRIALV